MEYFCLRCGYTQEGQPPTRCPVCNAPRDYFRSNEDIRRKADARIKEVIDNPNEKTKERFKAEHYRVSSGQNCCANCAHMEELDVGTYRERCLCRPMDYMFTNNDKNKNHICDMFMEGAQHDALLNELAMLIASSNKSTQSNNDSPEKAKQTAEQKGSGGCYIATATYGTYDCPQVWTLRRFRDSILNRTWYGRTFIRGYYAVSPKFVKYFGDVVWLKKRVRDVLDRFVFVLNKHGIPDTPYSDHI